MTDKYTAGMKSWIKQASLLNEDVSPLVRDSHLIP